MEKKWERKQQKIKKDSNEKNKDTIQEANKNKNGIKNYELDKKRKHKGREKRHEKRQKDERIKNKLVQKKLKRKKEKQATRLMNQRE